MDSKELKERIEVLKDLAKAQMGRMERTGLSGALGGLAQHLAADERVDLLFGGQVDGKQAAIALTDRRLLVAYGLVGRSYSIDYRAINQVKTGLTKVEVDGSGVNLEIKAVGRRDDLVAAISERRLSPGPVGISAAAESGGDPVVILAKLGELRDAGVLTDEEFTAKKAELLGRM
jgi:hypothetical protein